MAKVRVRRGSEGPRHDPYSYSEVTFTRTDGHEVVMHAGLMVWLEIDGVRYPGTEKQLFAVFEESTGMPFHRAEAVPYVVEAHRVRAMSPKDRRTYWAIKEADEQLLRWAQ